MSDQGHDPTRLQQATESTLAKLMSRYLTPMLLGIIAWFGINKLQDIQVGQERQSSLYEAQSAKIEQVRGDVQLLNAKVDYSVLQQISALDRRVNLLEETTSKGASGAGRGR